MLATELIAALQQVAADAEVIAVSGPQGGDVRLHEVSPDTGYIDPLALAELPEVIETARNAYPTMQVIRDGDAEAHGVPLEAKVSVVIGIPGTHWQVDRTLSADQLRTAGDEQWILRGALQGMTGLIVKTAGEAIADIDSATVEIREVEF